MGHKNVNIGELTGMHRADNNQPIWSCTNYNDAWQPVDIHLNNPTKSLHYDYDSFNHISGITYPGVYNRSFVWNNYTGNLYSRFDNIHSLNETFSYDNLDPRYRANPFAWYIYLNCLSTKSK